MVAPPPMAGPPSSFGSKYWKPLLLSGCLGILLSFALVILAIVGWRLYRDRKTIETGSDTVTAVTRDDSQQPFKKREDLLAQPLPTFLRARNPNAKPEGPPPTKSVDLTPVVLAAADAKSADLETRFMQALLAGQVDGAVALTTERWKDARGVEGLRLFTGLVADHGGGTFAVEKSARLPDGATATTGRVTFTDGTTAKVTVLSIDGKVDGFTAR
jgi:hypothetical protein